MSQTPSNRNSNDRRNFRPVSPSSHTGKTTDGRTIKKKCFKYEVMNLLLPGDVSSVNAWTWKEADGEKPAHWHARSHGVDMHLRDGLNPVTLAKTGCALVEVKERIVPNRETGGEPLCYVYLNLYPVPEGGRPTHTLIVTREKSQAEGGTIVFTQGGRTFSTTEAKIFKTWHRSAPVSVVRHDQHGVPKRLEVEGTVTLVTM